MEKFNPYDSEYHRVEDLPEKKQAAYANLDKGFVKSTVPLEEEKRKKEAMEQNKKRQFPQKLFNLNKTTSLDIAHEQALAENEERNKEIEDWVTLPMSPQEITESLQKEFAKQAEEKGIKLYIVDTENFTDWPNADERQGGYFTVRKAFNGIFKNGLKSTESLETLTECDFKFSHIPKHTLETGYNIMPVAFELAPVLTPRYIKDGIKGRFALKFVMDIPKNSSFISIKALPYEKTKAKGIAEAERKQIKKMSRRQWAIAKSYNLRKTIKGS